MKRILLPLTIVTLALPATAQEEAMNKGTNQPTLAADVSEKKTLAVLEDLHENQRRQSHAGLSESGHRQPQA